MKHLHFVGIGGARLSALAKLYYERGFQISGSDTTESKLINGLVQKGIKVSLGHHAENVHGADQVVYTNAVGEENVEVIEAKKLKIPLIEGAVLLGRLMEEVGVGIAIAGTHGKTTTSAMTSLILTAGGIDPTVLIGGEVSAFDGNHRTGKSPYMVVEACEFRRSFLNLKPKIELITNIDWDHPDCFPTLNDVIKTFQDFIELLPEEGVLIVWGDDPNIQELQKIYKGRLITFGYDASFDWSLTNIRHSPEGSLGIVADLKHQGQKVDQLRLKVPGHHNLQNALGAVVIAHELGVNLKTALKTVAEFTGVRRRFEIKGYYNQALVIDDYAHHPEAVKKTLAAAREAPFGRTICVFQPHLYSRTKHLKEEFAQSFNGADILILADIYAAREKDPGDISSKILAELTSTYHQDVRYLGEFDLIIDKLKEELRPNDLLITMGAGNIFKVGEQLVK